MSNDQEKRKTRTEAVPRSVYALVDGSGHVAGWYDTRHAAIIDAVGPRFRTGSKVYRYERQPLRKSAR